VGAVVVVCNSKTRLDRKNSIRKGERWRGGKERGSYQPSSTSLDRQSALVA
jgi:hypothetical protein